MIKKPTNHSLDVYAQKNAKERQVILLTTIPEDIFGNPLNVSVIAFDPGSDCTFQTTSISFLRLYERMPSGTSFTATND